MDVFPDTPVSSLLLEGDRAIGVITQDKGVDSQGQPKEDYQQGYAI